MRWVLKNILVLDLLVIMGVESFVAPGFSSPQRVVLNSLPTPKQSSQQRDIKNTKDESSNPGPSPMQKTLKLHPPNFGSLASLSFLPPPNTLPKLSAKNSEQYVKVSDEDLSEIKASEYVLDTISDLSIIACQQSCSAKKKCSRFLFCKPSEMAGLKECSSGLCGTINGTCYLMTSEGKTRITVNVSRTTCRTKAREKTQNEVIDVNSVSKHTQGTTSATEERKSQTPTTIAVFSNTHESTAVTALTELSSTEAVPTKTKLSTKAPKLAHSPNSKSNDPISQKKGTRPKPKSAQRFHSKKHTRAKPASNQRSCKKVPENVNQGVTKIRRTSSRLYPRIVTYGCKEGYKYITGSTEAKCDKSGKWTMPATLCAPKHCFIKVNGKAVYAGDNDGVDRAMECQKWTAKSVKSEAHWYTVSNSFLSEPMVEVKNYCRDPSGKGRPWCFNKGFEEGTWHSCRIPPCKEAPVCGVPPHVSGTVPVKTEVTDQTVTVTYACRRGLTKYSGDATSKCDRATDSWRKITTLLCASKECYYYHSQLKKNIYDGYKSITEGWYKCQSFNSDWPQIHKHHSASEFPTDHTMEEVGDHCRDPDNSEKPWCYTSSLFVRWKYCQIKKCFPQDQ